ncbi:MAG: hypothetical protein IKA22_00960 [Lentisphaeria bacterium]|nr:hypothetical protein [Lentisphaeria bacterium]
MGSNPISSTIKKFSRSLSGFNFLMVERSRKASLHAPKVRFMARSAASYAVRRAS